MQHTKTPWRLGAPSQMGSVVADEPVPEIKGSEAVDYYGGHLIAESIAPRNAEFIVRACNSHDQLVAALDAMVKRIEYYSSLADDARPNIEQWEYTEGSSDMERARDALAAARGAA